MLGNIILLFNFKLYDKITNYHITKTTSLKNTMNSNKLLVIHEIVLTEDENIEENYENCPINYYDDEEFLAAEQLLKRFKRNKRVCIRNYNDVSIKKKSIECHLKVTIFCVGD